jgi:hypothetical protein
MRSAINSIRLEVRSSPRSNARLLPDKVRSSVSPVLGENNRPGSPANTNNQPPTTSNKPLHKRKGIPYDPAQDYYSEAGFVFSKDRVEAFSQHLIRLNESLHIEHVLFHGQRCLSRLD